MTIRYKDYLDKVSDGSIDLSDMYYNVMLVSYDYTPSDLHKPADVEKYIIKALGVLTLDDIKKKSMSEILDEAKALLQTGIQMFPSEICDQIDTVISDSKKREKLKEIIRMPQGPLQGFQYWEKLKDNGVGYFVFESPVHGVLCFSEEVSL